MRALALLITLPLAGCASPEAPAEISDLTRFFIREIDRADDDLLADGFLNFEAAVADVDLNATRLVDRAWEPESVSDEDVWDTEHADAPVDRCIGVAVGWRSPHGMDLHLRSMLEFDQTSAQPSAQNYERTFLEGDARCFESGDCGRALTSNFAERSNLLYTIAYEFPKLFRRLELPDGRLAVLGRSWLDRSHLAEDGETELILSWVADVYMGDPEDGTIRYQAIYSHSFIPNVNDPTIIANTVRLSTGDMFEAEDDRIVELYVSD